MNKVSVLDCTLRDGGYINNWKFGESNIRDIVSNLVEAKVDIIECGFIRDVKHDVDSSVFSSVEQIEEVIRPKNRSVSYAVMVEQHNYNRDLISEYNGDSIDIIRLTFRKNEWPEAKQTAKEIMEKGYKVCIQPVGTASYDDETLMGLLRDVNELSPFAFYLVDTLGVMYRHDMRRLFYLIDNNLSQNICLGFHSHNNLQMSFSNAQEMMRLNRKRNIIIDSSCYGMGRGVGNLATELLIDYINNNKEQRYSLIPILNIVDKYLMPIYAEQRWGYDLPYFLSAIVKCHPNYAAHLMKKETMGIEKIEKILSLIPQNSRGEYNAELIEQLYLDMQACDVDDFASQNELKERIHSREVLILGAGASIRIEKDRICNLIDEKAPFIITVNSVTSLFSTDAFFISNEKRLGSLRMDSASQGCVLATSNLSNLLDDNTLIFDYTSLLGEGDESDNSGAMLIRILKKIGVSKIYLAGFDGFDVDCSANYYDSSYKKAMDYDTAKRKNENISKQLMLALDGIEYEVITKTKYEI
ncbi:MAG: aldolase catalytic domain-containing protein [bacterium]|nr:aldolase catalytic domain-containing protein [bacterium]